MKTYDTYKDSGIAWIGEIPSEWEVKRLGNFYNIRNEKVSDKDFPPLSVTMKGIVPQLETAAKTDDGDNRKLVRKGDFAINSRSDRRGSCGISAYDGSVSLINTVLCPKGEMNANFYNWLFHTSMFADEYYRWGHGIVDDLWTTRWSEMKNIEVVNPSLYEQQSIASFLDKRCGEIDSLISLQEEMISELQAYKQSVITEAVTKGLDPNAPMKDSGVEWIGEIPEGWKMCRFKTVAKVKANLVHPDDYLEMPQVAPDCIEKGSGKIIKYQTVRDANVISDNHLFYKGQIVYSKIRPMLNKVIIAPFDGLCCADMYPIETSENQKFFLYQMLSNVFNNQVAVVVQDRVKMPKINKEELDQILVFIPPLKYQEEIVEMLDEKTQQIDSLISIKRKKIEELKDYKKSIIYEYVTGKKRV